MSTRLDLGLLQSVQASAVRDTREARSALLAALFFGFADKLAGYLAGISSPIPSDFLAMLPYLATILAVVAGLT